MKHISPQDAIDQFWDRFNSKAPGKATTILPRDIYAKKASDSAPKGMISGQNAVADYTQAVELCKAKVEKIVRECRRINEKYRDPHFDIEFDLKWGRRDCLESLPIPNKKMSEFKPQSVKRVTDIFDAPQFYIGGATVDDIRQGKMGDCWLMAALCVLGNKESLIERVCVARDEQVGVYGFVFHRDGTWISEIIDDKLYVSKPDYDESFLERVLWDDRERISSEEDYRKAYQSNSGALYFAQCQDPNETWLPLLEKAYAKAHGDFMAIEGGFTGEGIEDLTGGVTTEIFTSDILDKEAFWKKELMKVNEDFLFGCSTGLFKGWGERKGIKEGHAYSIMKAVEIEDHRLLLLKNPWGRGEWTGAWSDGSKEWTADWLQKLQHRFGNDGAFWISFEDLLRKYQSFDRTRLFTAEWKIAQHWTMLQIPWTVDYHDTKFEIILGKDAPVVIVLSQLDGRYFRGLEGRYKFELSFRLHKGGNDDYIVRSHGNYCMRRSVSVELPLEQGAYHVLLKIRAERDTCVDPIEKVVKDNCKTKRDKLLRIGLSYDLAHSKGQVVDTEAEKQRKEAAATRKKVREQDEIRKALMKLRNREKHLSNKAKKRVKIKNAKDRAKEARTTEKAAKLGKPVNLESFVATAPEDKQAASEAAAPLEKESVIENNTKNSSYESSYEPVQQHGNIVTSNNAVIAPPKADSVPPSVTPKTNLTIVGVSTDPNTDEQLSPTTPKTKLLPPPSESEDDDCKSPRSEAATKHTPTTARVLPPRHSEDSEDDSVASEVTHGTIESELTRRKAPGATTKPCAAPPPCTRHHAAKEEEEEEEEEDEFQRDPWNAWCVVGLRVYSKDADAMIRVIRPQTCEDAEASLDVDDSAADATKRTAEGAMAAATPKAAPVELDGGAADAAHSSYMGRGGLAA